MTWTLLSKYNMRKRTRINCCQRIHELQFGTNVHWEDVPKFSWIPCLFYVHTNLWNMHETPIKITDHTDRLEEIPLCIVAKMVLTFVQTLHLRWPYELIGIHFERQIAEHTLGTTWKVQRKNKYTVLLLLDQQNFCVVLFQFSPRNSFCITVKFALKAIPFTLLDTWYDRRVPPNLQL